MWTSKDEHGFTWENDARYYYYLHGPLARSEIGDHEVQGLDYAYTLQGWLKGINGQTLDPAKDMGEDGLLSNPVYKNFSRDVMAFSLGYHNNDYKPLGNTTATAFGLTFTAPTGLAGTSGNTGYELFNGNIRNTTLALNKLNGGATSGYSYLYDQLNRLTATKQHNISGTSWSFSSFNEAYRERTTYDANGNIMRYLRQGANVSGMPLDMDSLTYNYYAGSNKLSFVRDAIASGNYTGDVDMDNQSSANYDYDKIGNLMSDVQGGLSNISWNVYGKIRSITKTNGTTIHYKYDPSGNRIEKSVTSGGVTTRDFYIRDAQGNILSVYRHEGGTLKLEELHLFGSSRLGLTELKRTVAEETIPLYPVHDSSLIGWKRYELGNHLGNVLAVISDKKTGVAGSGSSIDYYTAEVISEQDYYPFGMGMPGRKWSVGNYAFGFNGKMNDNDVKGEGNQQDYGMRIYDPRLGRFLSVDILARAYPWYTPYQFAGNMPIWAVDMDGAEERIIGDSRYVYEDLRKGGASHENALAGQFARNAGGAAGAILGNGIVFAPFLIPHVMTAGTGGILFLSNPSNQHLVSQITGFTVEILNNDPNGLPINFPGEGDEVAKGVKAMFKQFKIPMLKMESGFILNTERFKYFFDKLDYKGLSEAELEKYASSVGQTIERLTHNLDRSKSMNDVFAKWGVTDSKQGLEWLADAFNKGLNGKIISQQTLKDGTVSIMRSVNVINTKTKQVIGNMQIGYLYRNGDLNSTPEIGTIITKDYTKE